ncbi:MAG TPA: choline dehydrogenase [Aestuariivirga sp.]|nr:choline dehydrogenase [Aestuariivirga sp.]
MAEPREADYVIVGGGSAGCVLANRLSADKDVKVILLEAGKWDRHPFIRMPAGFLPLMQSGALDWGYHSEPQKNLNGRKLYLPRGKVIGGSSAINGMVYFRGDESDYDQWAQLGNPGWSFADCLPYFIRSEGHKSGPREGHGTGGPLKTLRHGVHHPLSKAFVAAAQQMGLPWNDDLNHGGQLGVGETDSTMLGNRRCSSADAYLHPVRSRSNLTVLTGARALRVLVENGRAAGVEFATGNGAASSLRAAREVILSGGAVNSPQLLQLSGIGDPDHLRSVGINVVHDLKGVGRNLQDHPAMTVKQLCSQPISLLTQTRPLTSALQVARYFITGGGPAAYHGGEAQMLVKTRPDIVAPDLQYFMTNILYTNNGRTIIDKHGFMTYFTLQRPGSRGTVKIRAPDPASPPAIDLNYFDDPNDIAALREGIRISRELFAQPAFDPYRGEEYQPGAAAKSNEELDAYIRSEVTSNYHLSGTCKMGNDPLAVVDHTLRVRGLDALRVIDASIMPRIVSGNTNAPTIMIAEKGAQMILEAL